MKFTIGFISFICMCYEYTQYLTGVPWLGEFFSHLVTHRYGHKDSFVFRLILDILPMFSVTDVLPPADFFLQGVGVFLVLVFKKKTLKRVMGRLRGKGSDSRQSTVRSQQSTYFSR